MITDQETSFLYLASSLAKKLPTFYRQWQQLLTEIGIAYSLLPNTLDIWAVDYMPIQIDTNRFIRFTYNPDYLQSDSARQTISDADSICSEIGISPIKSDLRIDGGNVVKWKNKVILCDKVFRENENRPRKELIQELEETLEVDKVIFVPTHPKDKIGHADGMIRFLDGNTVLINDLSKEEPSFATALIAALNNADLEWVEIPYNPYSNKTYVDATGIYINYLQMNSIIVIPTYGIQEDEEVVRVTGQLFAGKTIATIESREIAKSGGVLNCISWNILKQ